MSYKVFFVEDEIIAREGIRDNVDWQASGFEFCGEAADGEMALPLLRTTQPDVLITDIFMPDADGFEAIDAFRHEFPRTKIIVVSGGAQFTKRDYLPDAELIGVDATLQKPFDIDTLLRTLQSLGKP